MDVRVQPYDDRIEEFFYDDVTLDRLATGFGFTEGPLWCGDHLLFSDIPRNRIVKFQMKPEGPEITTFRTPTGNSNGLTKDASGRLISCEHSTRRVTRTEIDGTITVLAERYQGKRLNSPNDVVVRTDGSVYFTDPSFGLRNHPDDQELEVNGVYRVTPDGTLHLLADDFELPNGLAFSPDESILYVNDTARQQIRAFDMLPDGSMTNGRIITEMKEKEPGAPDGMKVDLRGNIYCTGPGGFWIMAPDGTPLGRVIMDELPSNLAWGDPDLRTMYITARESVYCIRLMMQGIPVPRPY